MGVAVAAEPGLSPFGLVVEGDPAEAVSVLEAVLVCPAFSARMNSSNPGTEFASSCSA